MVAHYRAEGMGVCKRTEHIQELLPLPVILAIVRQIPYVSEEGGLGEALPGRCQCVMPGAIAPAALGVAEDKGLETICRRQGRPGTRGSESLLPGGWQILHDAKPQHQLDCTLQEGSAGHGDIPFRSL